jgi:predicted MFS family arabinose efflux permease
MAPKTPQTDWLTGNPTKVQLWAVLWIASAGMQIFGLQPILLGALYGEGRVNFDELAMIATAELIMVALGSVIAGFLISTTHLRAKTALLLVVLGALNYSVSLATTPGELLLFRSLAGLVEGGMVAITVELIARSRHPERLGGMFIGLQTFAQLILAAFIALFIIPELGSNGGFLVLAAVCVLSLAAAPLVPAEYGKLVKPSSGKEGVYTLKSALALLVIFTFFLFIGAIWAFLEPLGVGSGIDVRTIGVLVSASLAVQLAGAICATWLERSIDYRISIVACTFLAIAACLALATQPGLVVFSAAALSVAFIWMFVTPYQIGLTIAADSSRNTALLLPAAQLLGAALGPVAASLLIVGDDASLVPWFAVGALLVSLTLLVFLVVYSRASAIPEGNLS